MAASSCDRLRLLRLGLGCFSSEDLVQKYMSSSERLTTSLVPSAWAATPRRRRRVVDSSACGGGEIGNNSS
jgi:hypothetical protein